ncbi:MAG TPA: XRE family transcriptional regulator [Mycobacterium sp.]|nr:XRE family transcriptional regulator [Mycobacterium sp.]
MAQLAPQERDSAIIVDLAEAAMHMYTAAIDALPFAEDRKFHKRADVVLSGLRKLRAALTDAASTSRPSPAVIAALSNVRRRYDSLMEHAAAAPGSSLGQQIYVTRVHAKLSATEVANGAGVRDDLLDELEAGGTPTDEEATKIKEAIAALGGLPGTEHLQPQQPEPKPEAEPEPEPEPEESAEPHVNGWDGELVSDNAG